MRPFFASTLSLLSEAFQQFHKEDSNKILRSALFPISLRAVHCVLLFVAIMLVKLVNASSGNSSVVV